MLEFDDALDALGATLQFWPAERKQRVRLRSAGLFETPAAQREAQWEAKPKTSSAAADAALVDLATGKSLWLRLSGETSLSLTWPAGSELQRS